MFDVLQQSMPVPRTPEGPSRERKATRGSHGRRGLQEIIQQTCAPILHISKRRDGPVGDLWLDSKGKRWLPVMEDRLGRRDLFKAIQEGRPLTTGKQTGDIWLDKKGKR